MKKIKGYRRLLDALVIVLLIGSLALAAEAQRTYQEDGHFYIIDFTYSTEYATVPLTSPLGQAHYSATITVSEIIEGNKNKIATFGGQYTNNGCFEDDPKSLVAQAREIVKKR